MWFVYILECADGTLYTGITNDLAARILKHENGTGAKYTRGRGPFTVQFRQAFKTRSAASAREAQIKSLSRDAKLSLIA